MKFPLYAAGLLVLLTGVAAENGTTTYRAWPPPDFRGPISYFQKDRGIVFYVESDGRHVSAIDRAGKILWTRDPFVEGKLQPYRVDRPVIVVIGEPLKWMTDLKKGTFVRINFNSTQFGILNVENGDFTFMGND